tara:strand:+ start:1030 stop:1959 length:930 start_codon:yes stop_codon:yes gene_type:complete
MKLSLDALQVLDAIDHKGSFAAAAASLHRVPSSVSYTVGKLEQDLGVTLFQKQGRRAVLTNAGRLLVERGRDLLLAAEQLSRDAQQTATGWEPRLRIAKDHSVADELLLGALQALYRAVPGIEVRISEEVLGGVWEALLEDRADLLVGAVDAPPGEKGIRQLPWLDLNFVFVAHRDHPICAEPLPLTPEALRRHRVVVVRDSSRNQPAISRGIVGMGSTLQVAGMRQKLQAQLAGLGIGTLPLYLVQPYLDSGELVQLTVDPPLSHGPCRLAWKASNRGRALALVVQHLLESAPQGAVSPARGKAKATR